MARKLGIWGDIDEHLSKGVKPQVFFPKAAKVIVAKRPPGRPRVHPVGARPLTGPGWRMRTPAGHALKCKAKGCRNRVPKNEESIVCSERCRLALLDYCETTAAVLKNEITASDYPPRYRSSRISRRAA